MSIEFPKTARRTVRMLALSAGGLLLAGCGAGDHSLQETSAAVEATASESASDVYQDFGCHDLPVKFEQEGFVVTAKYCVPASASMDANYAEVHLGVPEADYDMKMMDIHCMLGRMYAEVSGDLVGAQQVMATEYDNLSRYDGLCADGMSPEDALMAVNLS